MNIVIIFLFWFLIVSIFACCLTFVVNKNVKMTFLSFGLLCCLIIAFVGTNYSIHNKLIKIGQEIEHKQIIGYEDRIIFIAEEGGITIPWYIHRDVENNGQTYTVTVDINSGIYIHTPTKGNQRYYHSKQ